MMPVPDEMLRDAASEPPRSADGDVIMSEEKALAFVTLDGRVIPIGKGHWVVSSAKF